MTQEILALVAAGLIHEQIKNDDAFLGYDAKDAGHFDCLLDEVTAVVNDIDGIPTVDLVVETWYNYQEEICNGVRDILWFG